MMKSSATTANVNARHGSLLDETFLDVLDRREVDVFFGVEFGYGLGVDQIQSTIGHLKDAPGWRLIARGPRFAIYLRANLRNQENLEPGRRLLRAAGRQSRGSGHRERAAERRVDGATAYLAISSMAAMSGSA